MLEARGLYRHLTDGVAEVLRAAERRADGQGSGFRVDEALLVGGSTHRGEEGALASAYRALASRHAGVRLILVPRHPERAAEVVSKLGGLGLSALRRTSLAEAGGRSTRGAAGPTPRARGRTWGW